jgi:hypothetical protein
VIGRTGERALLVGAARAGLTLNPSGIAGRLSGGSLALICAEQPRQEWGTAFDVVNALADGILACGLTDHSVAGDWRLPNRNELTSPLDLGTFSPALPSGHPFVNYGPPGGPEL